MRSPSSSNHLEYIEELGFKEEHFLAHNVQHPVFVEYTPLPTIGELWERMGRKRKATNDGYEIFNEPSEGAGSSGGYNKRWTKGAPPVQYKKLNAS